jgi:hypothetical protein
MAQDLVQQDLDSKSPAQQQFVNTCCQESLLGYQVPYPYCAEALGRANLSLHFPPGFKMLKTLKLEVLYFI